MRKLALIMALSLVLPSVVLGADSPFGTTSAVSVTPNAVAVQNKGPDLDAMLTKAQEAASAKAFAPYRSKTLDQVFAELNNKETDAFGRVRFIPENDVSWYVRWKMINDCKETLDCTYYIVDKDIFGQAFLGLLARKARQGVKIRLMVDGRIYRSGYMKGMPERFRALSVFPNVEIKLYNSVTQSLLHIFTDFAGVYASNHKKIILPDGKMALTGGRNIGPDYFVQHGEYECVYRDTDILVEGENAARHFKAAFEEEWKGLRNANVKPNPKTMTQELDRIEIAARVMDRYINGKGILDPKNTRYAEEHKKVLAELNSEIVKFKGIVGYSGFECFTNEPVLPVKILEKTSSLGKLNEIGPCLQALCEAAREEIIIQNPYVVLSDEAWASLKRASQRGVKIIFHSNSGASTDSLFPQAFLMNDWKKMLTDMPTCRILVAPGAKQRLHSKTFLIDRQITIVGSYNMDPLSQTANAEAMAVVNDKALGQAVYEQIQKDIANGVIEYKIKLDKNGKVVSAYGPEDHLDSKTLRKMNIYRRLKWIKPMI